MTDIRAFTEAPRGDSGEHYIQDPNGPAFCWSTIPSSFYGHKGYASYVLNATGAQPTGEQQADYPRSPAYQGSNESVQMHSTPEEARAHALSLYKGWKATGVVPNQIPLTWR
jgi:hypothetical protein